MREIEKEIDCLTMRLANLVILGTKAQGIMRDGVIIESGYVWNDKKLEYFYNEGMKRLCDLMETRVRYICWRGLTGGQDEAKD